MIGGRRSGSRATATCGLRPGLLCAVLFFAMTGCGDTGKTTPGAVTGGPARNLLLITVDTLRADHLSACGNPRHLTPHLDALSRRGMLIPAVVTPANTTLPAHASLLTSLPPEGHGGFGNGMAIHRGLPTLAGACRDSGMATAAMVSSWVVGTAWNLDQGFDEYIPLYQTERRPAPSPPDHFLPIRAEDTSRAAVRWLRQHADQQFMLWIHYMDPHQEYDPPPPFDPPPSEEVDRPRSPVQFLDLFHRHETLTPEAASSVRADYAGEVRYTDRCIGDILRLLRVLGLERETLVVVTADHGEALGEKDHYFGHTLSLVEPVNRVPLILAGPPVSSAVTDLTATLLDAAPTILSLLGINIPDGFQGRDLSPYLTGLGTGDANTPAALSAPLLFTRGENGRRAWLVDGMQATFDPEGRITSLYNLEQDSREAHDLVDEFPGLAEDLARRYMVPHTELAAMAAQWTESPEPVDAETARKLKELGYVD